MRCYNCKSEKMAAWEGQRKVAGVTVQARGSRCSNCGEVLFTDAEVERQERDAAGLLAARGVRTGNEFKFVRKVVGLKAIEAAKLLDVEPGTVSRWERGETKIPHLVAFAIAELLERPRVVRQRLEALAG